jgi:D-glycero-D-manno-heptose 1,7-bisphosphate phosphatase
VPAASDGGAPRPAVFLDRDGVLNHAVVHDGVARSPTTVDDLHIIDGVPEALAALREAGYLLVGVTNQPDIARGRATWEAVRSIHDALRATLSLDGLSVCPHDTTDGCACRKPLPGMIDDAVRAFGIDVPASWLVGDRWVDIAAGDAAGVRTVLIDRAYSWAATSSGAPPAGLGPTFRAADLTEAAAVILSR